MDDEDYTKFIAFWANTGKQARALLIVYLGYLALGFRILGQVAHTLYVIADVVLRRGWRIILPWQFIYLIGGISDRIVHGLPLPDVASLAAAVVPVAGTVAIALITRFMEVRAGQANGPSIILSTIGQIFQNFNQSTTPDGAPRMVVPA